MKEPNDGAPYPLTGWQSALMWLLIIAGNVALCSGCAWLTLFLVEVMK